MDGTIEPMPEAPEGTCLCLAPRGVWAVRGRTGWYRCNAETRVCECAEYLHRRKERIGRALTACRHLIALEKHLKSLAPIGPMLTDAELRRLFG